MTDSRICLRQKGKNSEPKCEKDLAVDVQAADGRQAADGAQVAVGEMAGADDEVVDNDK